MNILADAVAGFFGGALSLVVAWLVYGPLDRWIGARWPAYRKVNQTCSCFVCRYQRWFVRLMETPLWR